MQEAIAAVFADLKAGRIGSAPATPAADRVRSAAFDLFAERGFDGTTTKAIAARAGVAEKTLFAHYPSKAVLYAEALRPHLEALLGPSEFAGLMPILADPTLAPRDRFRALAANRLALVRSRPGLLRLLVRELLTHDALRVAFVDYWCATIEPIVIARLTDAQEQGQVAPDPPHRVLLVLMSSILGYAAWSTLLTTEGSRDDGAELDALLALLFRGLAGDQPSIEKVKG